MERAVARARLALLWEGAWPRIAAGVAVAVLFLVVSWFGLWDALPPIGRMIGVGVFAAALVAPLVPLLRSALPDRKAALGRIDRESGVAHRPATSLDDRLASTTGEDPMTRALWAAHRERLQRDAVQLKAGSPAPRLAARDPYALRFLLGLVAVAAFAVAGSDRGARVSAAFDWASPAVEAAPARLDAWVAPPAYTGRPPIFLTARNTGADAPAPAESPSAADVVSAPANSVLVIRGSGGEVEISAEGDARPVDNPARPPEGVVERRFQLTGDAEARVSSPGVPDRIWRFTIAPDEPPAIALSGPPRPNARGTATLAYEVKDDYGVAAAEARFALKSAAPPNPPKFSRAAEEGGTEAATPRPLYEAPKVALSLPRARAREGKAETTLDVMEHPFAGADAVMTLVARDEAGQEGRSDPLDMRLPARDFTKPLARALVEQRRILALDANAKPRVLGALRALNMFPEEFSTSAAVYLGLATAYGRLEIAQSDDELRGVADYLWEIALRVEDGDLPETERDLRAAEEKLRKALENGASEEEIKKLTQELRAALEKFMKEMAEQQRRDPSGQQQAQPGQRGKEVSPQDLRDMVDRMEKLAQEGSRDAARQALADLKNMLDNLKTGRRGPPDPAQQAQQRQLDQLQDMIREQSKLRDETFQQYRQNDRQQRNLRNQQNRGQQQGGDADDRMKELAQRQQELREKLDQLRREQGQDGEQEQGEQGRQADGQEGRQNQPGGQQGEQPGQPGRQAGREGGQQQGENALGDAGESMGQARGALGQGQTGEALDQQQKALEQLRKGAQAMAEAMQKGQGQPGQQGAEGEPGGESGEEAQNEDPLGRPTRRRDAGDGATTKVPGEIDAQRARRVLEELRKRLGEADRSRDELDYIERLLAP